MITRAEKKDIIYVISKEMSNLYKLGAVSFSFPYESEDITDSTDLIEYIEKIFVKPYDVAIKQKWYPEKPLDDERIYVIDAIQSFLGEYERKKKEDDNLYNPEISLSTELKKRVKYAWQRLFTHWR